MLLYLKWVSCNQDIQTQSDNCCPLIKVFKPFTFNIITNNILLPFILLENFFYYILYSFWLIGGIILGFKHF